MRWIALAFALAAASPSGLAQVNIDDIRQADKLGASAPLGDAELAERVRSALLREPGLEPLKVDVEARAGHVSLEGVARTSEERYKASRAAARVPGVVSVTNNLALPQGSPSTGE